MKKFLVHARIYIFRGLLAIIPVFLSIMAVQLLYVLIDRRAVVFLNKFIEVRRIPGLGILLVLISLYLIGLVVSNVIGRAFFHFIERISQKIPVIKVVYNVGKQLSQGLSDVDGKQAFKKVLLVKWNDSGLWAVSFVAGEIAGRQGSGSMLKVFVPNVPSPTSGFIFLVNESDTIDPGWTVEEAVKMVVSGAIISPKEIRGPGRMV